MTSSGSVRDYALKCRPLDGESMDHEGRKLLAQSDDRYNFYKNSDTCKAKSSLMVCKSCTATNLSGVSLSTRDGGFSIWCFDSGDITNNVSIPSFNLYEAFLQARIFSSTYKVLEHEAS